MVKILYFADFKTITHKDEEYINLNQLKTLGELINKLIKKYPLLKKILLEEKTNTIKNTISVAINHCIIKNHNLNSQLLLKDDILAFLLPVSGG